MRYGTNIYRCAVLCVFLFACCFFIAPCAAEDTPDETGPTIRLDYGADKLKPNPADNWMYFVPIVSPTPIDSKTSKGNTQTAQIISFERKKKGKNFTVLCDFQMKGKGDHKNTFEPVAMIDNYAKIRKTKTLNSMLDYIVLNGTGYGTIEVTGRIEDGAEVVKEVKIHFNRRGQKSPVRIGIYNVKSKKGKFDYADRYSEMVARVNTLTFKKTDKNPKMYVSVASIVKAKGKEGFLGNLVGAIANFFIPPVEIDIAGNNAMLDFGTALCSKKDSFTFPKAKNLVDDPLPIIAKPQKAPGN